MQIYLIDYLLRLENSFHKPKPVLNVLFNHTTAYPG